MVLGFVAFGGFGFWCFGGLGLVFAVVCDFGLQLVFAALFVDVFWCLAFGCFVVVV